MKDLISTHFDQPSKGGLIKRLFKTKERQEQKELNGLMIQVAEKLSGDMYYGRVSFFSDKKSKTIDQEAYTLPLKSEKHPSIDVHIWKRFAPAKHSIGPSYRLVFEIWDFNYKNTEKSTMFSIVQHWNNDYEFMFNRNDRTIPHFERVKFLSEVLETEIDHKRLEEYFHKPYQPGATISYSDDNSIHDHVAFWVRDLADSGVSLLNSGPLQPPR